MHCPKKFLPACWHLSRVLLESEVWVRPAQVGAFFLHNLRVCLTFGHVMYPQNNSYTTWGCADSFGMLCTFKIMLHYSYTTWGCADFFGVFQAVCRKGLGAGWWPFTGRDPLVGPWDHKKVLCSNRDMVCRWNFGNELDLGVPMPCQVRCVLFCLQYIHICYVFIYRSRWKQVYKSSMEKVVPMCCACQLA